MRRRRRKARATAFMVAALVAACAPDEPSVETVAVVNARVIDGLGGAPMQNGTVVVQEGRITAVGPASDVVVPDGARVVDASGGSVLPGLADMHVHLLGGWDGLSSDMLGYRRYLRSLLYAGVTTVLDAGNVLIYVQQLRAEIQAGRLAGPRIYMVGPLIDGPEPVWPPITYAVHDASRVRPYVEQLAAAGVDALKGYVGLSRPMLDSLVAAGRDHELPVIADLGPATSSYATQAGVAARAHAPTVTWTDEAIAAMVDRGVASITTLAVVESFSRRRVGNLRFLEHPLIARTTPPWFLEELRAAAERQPSSEEAERLARILQRLDTAQANVRRMHEAGVLVVAGTDAPYPGVFQGEGIHRELELLVEAGLTPLQAISTATYNAARLMDADAEWGRIAPGLAGDLVVVRGDPTVDVAATREIMAVIRNGVVLDREALTFESLNDPGFRATGSVAPN